MINNPPVATLEDVHKQFINWRNTKKHSDKIPKELWQCVIKLHTNYAPTVIRNRLGISTSQYKQHVLPTALATSKLLNKNAQQKNQEQQFISIPLASTPLVSSANLTIERPDGIKLHISQCSNDYILTIIKAL
jgi:hypothetical protein